MRAKLERFSNTLALLQKLPQAQSRGLFAAANVIRNAVKRSLRHGYHSSLGNWGDFVTGNNINHVTISEPIFTADGGSIKVGTDLMYALFWEVGHHNIFTRHFERDEKWGPAYRESRAAALDAYQRAFSASWKYGGGIMLNDQGIASWISGAGSESSE